MKNLLNFGDKHVINVSLDIQVPNSIFFALLHNSREEVSSFPTNKDGLCVGRPWNGLAQLKLFSNRIT